MAKKVDIIKQFVRTHPNSVCAIQELHGNQLTLFREMHEIRRKFFMFTSFPIVDDGDPDRWHRAGGLVTIFPRPSGGDGERVRFRKKEWVKGRIMSLTAFLPSHTLVHWNMH
eukprot:7429414-Alexandrium_andersonii.AAC.1